jgi:deoxyribodipyrimidine photo-lyase
MTPVDLFPPTLAAAHARIAAVRPGDYARTRNHLDGAVSRLSPYVTHGFVSLDDVLRGVNERHPLPVQHKFVFELGWRAYFRHVWQHRGDGILESLHPGLQPEDAYTRELPADLREARTGVPVIDQAVRDLYATGYLHNHARMWLASYVVHVRKLHWRVGADWMLAHLLDGDLASNALSWQWVAGTGSHKPYLFNADNVARYAPTSWHSAGTVIDTSYEALDSIAHNPVPPLPPHPPRATPADEGLDEPPRLHRPPVAPPSPEIAMAEVAGRDVWLVHPWCLGDPPLDLPANGLRLGWWPAEFHDAWPWSERRWRFVGTRLSALTDSQCMGDRDQLARIVAAARSVQTLADEHANPWLPPGVRRRAAPRLFPEVQRLCPSFSTWWNRCTRGLAQAAELPGLTRAERLQ